MLKYHNVKTQHNPNEVEQSKDKKNNAKESEYFVEFCAYACCCFCHNSCLILFKAVSVNQSGF